MIQDIQRKFEEAFDIPFTSSYGIDGHDIWYEIGYYSNYIDRTNYLPFFDEDNSLYILYGNGKTKRIMKDFE